MTSAAMSSSLRNKLIIASVVTLGVTILRLAGELNDWSLLLFNPNAGGFGALVGITWLAPLVGIVLALDLAGSGLGPDSSRRALGAAIIGVLILIGGVLLQAFILESSVFAGLLYSWSVGIVAAAIQVVAWPQLFRALLVYGLAARIPVVVIMFFAMQGNWGTHYDAVPPGFPELGLTGRFLWLGFFPQLTFWVGFTIVFGMLFGSMAAVVAGAQRKSDR